MPKRLAVGSNLGLFSRRTARENPRRTAKPGVKPAPSMFESLENRTLLSATYFVATYGNDAGAGTFNSPFRTIQRAANVANWGDTVDIRGGTYRETVTPAHSGVTFQAYNGENVTVTGNNQVSGWTRYSGNIWEANMPFSLGEGNDQVFVNGQAVNEARWPNSTNLSYPSVETAYNVSGGGRVTIRDPRLSGGWAGGVIHFHAGEGWYAQTGSIVASGPGWLTFTYQQDGGYMAFRPGNTFYLYGKFQGLDTSNEFFRDGSGHLYLWAPGNADPNNELVEAQARQYTFNLINKSNVTIEGINTTAGTIETNSNSSNVVIDHVHASYLSQFSWQGIGWQQPWNSGIELNGANSVLENSTIAWSAGDGVYVSGRNCRVTGNVIHDVDTNAGDSAAIHVFGAGTTVDHNVVYNAARCGIIAKTNNVNILANTIYNVMLQSADGGAIYTIYQNGGGAQIAYNTIFGVHDRISSPNPSWYSANGIFLDNDCSNFSIHDNSVRDADAGLKLNYTARNVQVYNNQLQGKLGSIVGNGKGDWGGTVISNNMLYNPIWQAGGGARIAANHYTSGTPGSAASPPPIAAPTPPVVSSPAPTPAPTPSPSTVSAKSTIQAENYSNNSGLTSFGGYSGSADNGDWAEYANVDFGSGVSSFTASVAVPSPYAGGRIELHLDGVNGKLVGVLTTKATNGWWTFNQQTASVSGATGVHNLFIKYVGGVGIGNVDWFRFA